jgi:predicted nucleic acid-binding protein
MKKYVVDSDVLIYFLKGDKKAIDKLSKISSLQLYTSRINYTELMYGAYNSSKVEKNLEVILAFLENFQILEFCKSSSCIFTQTKAKLKKSGNIIADMDLMIASIVMANDAVLITNNLKHFQRIQGLKVEGI